MDNFDLETYKIFVTSKIKNIYNKKSSLKKEDIISYCCQFELTPKEFFSSQNQSTISEKLRKVFDGSLKNKPASVAINTYFLFEYGYIRCSFCITIKHKNNFYCHKNTWNGYKHYCIDCQKEIRDNEHSKVYQRNNRYKYAAYLAKYRAAKLNATPSWLTKDHYLEIQEIYKRAKEQNLEVDHIIPLQSNTVCGLHVPWNLQLLSRRENASKSNKYIKEEEVFAGEPLKTKTL